MHGLIRPVPEPARAIGPLHSQQHVGTATPVTVYEAGLDDGFHPSLHGGHGCICSRVFRLLRKVSDPQASGAQARDIGSLVLQTALLQHAQVRILPSGLGDLTFGEAEIERRQMTAGQVICQIGGGYCDSSLPYSHCLITRLPL